MTEINSAVMSVIIPTCQRNDQLFRCLKALMPGAQTCDQNLYEVIVTDDGRDVTAQHMITTEFPWVKWVKGPSKGPAANRNNGAKHARGSWLVFTDDDCLPECHWLETYLRHITTGVKSKVLEGLTNADRPRQRFDEVAPINLTGGNLWSCNFAVEKKLFDDVGGFDENFPYPDMEDTDLYVRLQKFTGIAFLPDAIVIHPWRKMKPFRTYKKRIVSNEYFLNKHLIRKDYKFRISRLKIFIGSIFSLGAELAKFSFRGTGLYVERVLFDFLMVVRK
jgi:GT2 family glycosyltransferase